MRDVLTSTGPIRDPQGKILEAIEILGDYSYRKEFGLSYFDFIKEPLEEYLRNKEIMGIISEIQRSNQKRAERTSER